MEDKKKNVSIISNCYGCGVCALACGKKIIDICINKDGFYEPIIRSESLCISCGLCLSVCSFYNKGLSVINSVKASYASWSLTPEIRYKCSSGGIGYEVSKILLSEGYYVCGVKYNINKERVEHYIATRIEDLEESIGSKYLQSYTFDAFRKIQIDRDNKYLVIGTPCQIDSFRRLAKLTKQEKRFVFLDFFCHGVPSILSWKKYLVLIGMEKEKLEYVSWRNKAWGWHDSWAVTIDYKNELNKEYCEQKSYVSRLSKGDIFYSLFLGGFCDNPACIKHCKYKYDQSAADIRIGDLWGKTYKRDQKGVSALVCNTSIGCEIISKLKKNCFLSEHSFATVAEGQMKKNAKKAYFSNLAWRMLKSTKVYPLAYWKILLRIEYLLKVPQLLGMRFKNVVQRIISINR